MHLCYVDESGNDQVLVAADAPPVLVIAGLILPEVKLKSAIWGLLDVKKQFNSSLRTVPLSELIKTEIKGADLRADLRSGSRNRIRRAIGVLDRVMDVIEGANASLVGQIWVKNDGHGVGPNYYADSIARIAVEFQSLLAASRTKGIMILDAQTKWKNVPNVHTITTRKYKRGGDLLSDLAESPVFGHSDAHVALQLADIVASAMLFPMACLAYCDGLQNNVHPHPEYERVRTRYASRLRALEYRYPDAEGVRRGGIVVRDKRGKRSSVELYGQDQKSAPSRPNRRSFKAAKTLARLRPRPAPRQLRAAKATDDADPEAAG